ncbi:MAG TPA: Mut7-C RNAse domain-containing protein [Candidatus Bathyarchaeia archaeon]|nr:Mut7-C RNAse domain-containing protein [Candidatus Bathyarchaeia archaeon]
MTPPPCFAVDRTLGRLARWLRLLRFDTAYRSDLPGARLLTLAAREGRVLVTRDATLARARTGVAIVHIASDHFREQLRELDRRYPLGGVERREPRCAACNVLLEPVAGSALPASVPEYVRRTQSDFRRCPRCRRIYWPATHRTHMDAEIRALALTLPGGVEPEP